MNIPEEFLTCVSDSALNSDAKFLLRPLSNLTVRSDNLQNQPRIESLD